MLSFTFSATDKVALLIGNYDYKNETELKAPETDVSTLAQLFRHLDFKVVTLLNLTKTEMLSAVDYFSELLGKVCMLCSTSVGMALRRMESVILCHQMPRLAIQ